MKRITKHQIILLHKQLIEATGGASGTRDDGLLDSALEAIYSGFGGLEFYPSIQEKAARLAFGLVSNHPFIDGNKRVGVQAMLVLLALNGIAVVASDDDLIALGLGLASGRLSSEDALEWITAHIQGSS